MKKRFLCIVLLIISIMSVCSLAVNAEETKGEYRLGELYNTGKDNGYSERNSIDKDDLHYSWKMGEFFVTGFTRQVLDSDGTPVLLKNAGDKVTLWFDLQQDINALNDDEKIYVCEDKNGYEEYFKVEKQNLKKGALIIKHTDYQNKDGLSQTHIDYLSAKVSEKADTEVLLCEEGDYEVSLLYEIKNDSFLFFDSYQNYRIDLKFSVRNGNTMVFPFDVVTGQELTNSVFTENGFYIDLANSKYLNVDVKREVLNDSVDGLVEDTRYNRPAADGETFTEEGIYTITVTNQYTNVTTEKKIYVGNNDLLKAHVVTGLSIGEIQNKIANENSIIDGEGNIVPVNATVTEESDNSGKNIDEDLKISPVLIIVLVTVVVSVAIIVSVLTVKKKKRNVHILENSESDVLNEQGE